MHRTALACVLGALFVVVAAPRAAADDTLGLPWEEGIEAGIARQERERKQRPPEAILREAKLAASRRSEGATRVVRLYLLARAYGIAGDAASARSVYADLLAEAPRCYFAHHDLAMLALGQEPPDRRTAEAALRRAIGINPGFLTGQRKLALLLLQEERAEEALVFLRRIVDADPGDVQARYLLARTLVHAKRWEEADREVQQLLRRQPANDGFRMLAAEVEVGRGRPQEALGVYRDLATRNPAATEPLVGYLRALDVLREQHETLDVEGYLWALEGLLRLERDPERRAELERGLEEIRRAAAGGAREAGAEGPPSDARIAAGLADLPVEARIEALKYVYVRDEAPTPQLLRAVIGRLSPSAEPEPRARMWALRILGRFGGYGLAGLVRHALGDPALEVRPIAADVLVDLARTDPSAHAVAVLALGRLADTEDPVLGPALRGNLRALLGATFPEVEATDASARRVAFLAWWRGPAGSEAKVRALAAQGALGDPRPEDLLLAYLFDGDRYVAGAAWRALAEARTRLLEDAGLDPARRAWLASMPPYQDGAGARAAAGRLEAWSAARPR